MFVWGLALMDYWVVAVLLVFAVVAGVVYIALAEFARETRKSE